MKYSAMMAVAVLSGLSLTAHAQSVPDAAAMPYESAFKSYRPMDEIATPPTLEAWREANNTVARIGGHAGVLKGGEEGQAGHAGHTGHGTMSMEKQPAEARKQPTQSMQPAAPAKAPSHQGH